jgi:hypothetical protein
MISTAFTHWQPIRWYIDTFSMEPRRIRSLFGSSKSRASGACNAYQQAEGSDDLWNDDRANPRVSRTDLFVRLMEPVVPAEKNRKDCERNQAIQLHTPSPKEISAKRRKGCRKGTANGHEWTQKKTRRQEPESRSQEEAGSGEPRVMNRSEGSNQLVARPRDSLAPAC